MKELITKRNRNAFATKEEFLADVETLFAELENSYGGYEYFGEERFRRAKANVLQRIEAEKYTLETAIGTLREELAAFIFDGHFSIDGVPLMHPEREKTPASDYAVKRYEVDGIPVFDIKKFYYDNDEEKRQLEEFAASGAKYRDYPCLIFDLRGNGGGSDMYLWDFLCELNGEEPDVPLDFLQKKSDTFLEYLKAEYGIEDEALGIETERSDGKLLQTGQKIFVLIDRFVCSSGESAIAYLKTIEGTVLLGEHSGGCYFSGNCMDIYLPNSGVPIYYGTGRVLYKGTQNIDELGGFAPDITGEFEIADAVAMWRSEQEGSYCNSPIG